eukprot:tig00020604_g11858.t1
MNRVGPFSSSPLASVAPSRSTSPPSLLLLDSIQPSKPLFNEQQLASIALLNAAPERFLGRSQTPPSRPLNFSPTQTPRSDELPPPGLRRERVQRSASFGSSPGSASAVGLASLGSVETDGPVESTGRPSGGRGLADTCAAPHSKPKRPLSRPTSPDPEDEPDFELADTGSPRQYLQAPRPQQAAGSLWARGPLGGSLSPLMAFMDGDGSWASAAPSPRASPRPSPGPEERHPLERPQPPLLPPVLPPGPRPRLPVPRPAPPRPAPALAPLRPARPRRGPVDLVRAEGGGGGLAAGGPATPRSPASGGGALSVLDLCAALEALSEAPSPRAAPGSRRPALAPLPEAPGEFPPDDRPIPPDGRSPELLACPARPPSPDLEFAS